MRESITKFDLEAAFKALDEIDIPATDGVKANKPALTEIFSRKSKLESLLEEYYDISSEAELGDAKEAREAEVAQAKLARIEKIVDLDAESPEDLLPSYVGKFIMQCPQCMTLFYKDPEDVEASEEDPNTVNVNEVCQHCGNEAGYTLIGKVGEATQDEMAEYTEEETVDVTSTDEEAADEIPEEPEELSDEDLDLELDELDLDLEEPEEEDTKTEESFNNGNGGQKLTEVLDLQEGVWADTKQAVYEIMCKLAEDDNNAWAKTVADILAAIPDDTIDNLIEELYDKFENFSITSADREKIAGAAKVDLDMPEEIDTVGEVLDRLKQSSLSAEATKSILSAILAVIGVLEPTPVVEIIALIVAALPAEAIELVMTILNPTKAVIAGIDSVHKSIKSNVAESHDCLTESADLDVSADEFENLINSPEFKKPISDSEARAMMDELGESYYDDDFDPMSDDMMYYGKFLHARWVKDTPIIKQIAKNTYKVTRKDGRASVLVKINNTDTHDSTYKFTVNGKPFSTKHIRAAQDFILQELESTYIKQFNVDLDESVKVNGETLRYAVINSDGTYAGVPCTSEEEARDLAAQKKGRIIVELGALKEGIFDNKKDTNCEEALEEGIFDKLKDKAANLIDKVAGKLKTREDKANWILANAAEDYNKVRVDTSGELVPDEANQRFGTFVVIGYSNKYRNGKTITMAPSFNNKDLVIGMKKAQVTDKYERADDIAKGWSMTQGNGPAFIYLAKDENDGNAVFLCQYFKGELKNDQVEKYFGIIKNHLKGAKLMARGGMNDDEEETSEEDVQAEVANDFEKNKAAAKARIEQLADDKVGVATLAAIMTDLAELQEATLENLISNSLVEAYGNVAGFRLKECAYLNKKFTVGGTIHFTSGNTRNTTYTFTEASSGKDGKILLNGFNEKLGLDKQFTLAGRTDSTRTFITESFKCNK